MLVLYASRSCGPCKMAEQWLQQHRIAFQKILIDGNPQLIQQVAAASGQRTVPQFFLDGQWLQGGLARVKQLAYAGSLPRG